MKFAKWIEWIVIAMSLGILWSVNEALKRAGK